MKKDYFLLEKKELIVLILLLTLVGLVAFTIGIKMGKSLRDEEIKIADAHKPILVPTMEADLEKHGEQDSHSASMSPAEIMDDKLVKAVEGDKLPSSKALEENAKKHDKMQTKLPEEKNAKSEHGKAVKSEVNHAEANHSNSHEDKAQASGPKHGEDLTHSATLNKSKAPVIKAKDNVGKILSLIHISLKLVSFHSHELMY